MKKSALIIIDVQKGMFEESSPVYNGSELLQRLQGLLARAREKGLPIFYVQHQEPAGRQLEYGTEAWEIHDEIRPVSRDVLIHKKTPDSFHQTNLDEELKKRDIRHVILAGIQTEVCVDTTCRRAYSMGYKVTLVTDAHSTWPSETLSAEQIINHHNGALRWFADCKKAEEIEF